MSAITVYTALAARAVTFNAATVPVYWGETLPPSLASAQLPVRLLLPWQSSGTEAREYHAESLATANGPHAVERTFNDTFFYKPLTQDIFEEHIGALLNYEAAYEATMRSDRRMGTSISIVNWGTLLVMSEYPARSGVFYSAVSARVRVKELIG
jgi:hypothetical protein